MMLFIIVFIMAVLGLLFYWLFRYPVFKKDPYQEGKMSYGLEWTDALGQTVSEDIRPLILLGSVTLNKINIRKDIIVKFNSGGLKPYWIPVIKTGQGAMGSLMLEKAELTVNGSEAQYIFSATQTNFGDAGSSEIKIYYGVY